MHKILVIRLYFPLDALHVSDCISPSSGATLQAVHRVYRYMPVPYVCLLCGYRIQRQIDLQTYCAQILMCLIAQLCFSRYFIDVQ
jgi:hypothetical protein